MSCKSRSRTEVVDAVFHAFDVAVEHRGVGAEPELVGRAMDFEPGFRVGLAGADFRADLRVEDFRPSGGHAAQAGGDQLLQDRADWQAADAGKMVDLRGRPGLQVQPGKRGVQATGDAKVPVELLRRMRAADDVQLGAAGAGRLLRGSEQFGVAHRVRPRIVLVAAVGAQAQR